MSEIAIYDFIGEWGYGPKDLRADLEGKTGPLSVLMNSEGGDVFAGKTMYENLRAYEGTVTVTVQGVAASIASVIALAADRIQIADGARFMIHDPWTVAVGNAAELMKTAQLLTETKTELVKHYQTRMNWSDEQIADAMSEETWFTAEEAVEAGLADEMLPLPAVAANVYRQADHIHKWPLDLKVSEEYQAHAEQLASGLVRTRRSWQRRQSQADRQRTNDARRQIERLMAPSGTLEDCQAILDKRVPKP